MTVTRDVIYDLLPGYFAGELSADAKALVEEFFATDPEFARMAERFRKLFSERRGEAGQTASGREKVIFERARAVRTTRDRLFGIAAGCTLVALLALFLGALFPRDPALGLGFGFLRVLPAASILLFGGVAALAWMAWLASGRRRHFPWLCLCIMLAAAAAVSAQQGEWSDPSPHAARFVAVENDVQLEVLDWGGSGPALLLLAGLGDTAHVFDDFALTLTPRFHVVGVTRRGHRRSSAATTGYTFERLAEDIIRVIEVVGLNKPLIIGHSFAGDEMHVLGARYPGRIAGLVYVDAAFDRADASEAYDAVARTLPPSPRAGPGHMLSFTALRSFLEKTPGAVGPDAHLRARWIANADGTIARAWAPEPPVFQAMSREMQAAYKAFNPEPIRVPALAIYAVPRSTGDLMQPWYGADDPVIRGRVETLYRLARERFGRHAKWFAALADHGRVSELAGAHHLFISNAREVRDQINAFASSLN